MNKKINILKNTNNTIFKSKFLLLLFFLLISEFSFAQLIQDELKAAHLVTFRRFVEWKGINNKSLVYHVGIWGDKDDIALPLGTMLQQKFNGDAKVFTYKHDIKSLKADLNGDGIAVLYISEVRDIAELREVIDLVRGKKNILTVGNSIKNFCTQGGIINIAPSEAQRRFVINNEEAIKANLFISSKLLDLARIETTKR